MERSEIESKLEDIILVILSLKWMDVWLKSNSQHLKELRVLDPKLLDVSHEPEKAFSYMLACGRFKNHALVSIVIIIIASLLLMLVINNSQSPFDYQFKASYVFDLRFLCLASLTVTFIFQAVKGLMCYYKHLTTRASNHVGKAWSITRQQFIEVGFVDYFVGEVIKRIDTNETFNSDSRICLNRFVRGILKSMYLQFLENTAIPYVKSQQTGIADPAVDNSAKARFELALSLAPYLRITHDIPRIRQIVYDSARDRIQQKEFEEMETQEIPIR